MGPTGPQGVTGADSFVTGPMGPTGPQGVTGADSFITGPRGPTGADFISSGTVAGDFQAYRDKTETKGATYAIQGTDLGKTFVLDSAETKTFNLPSVESGDIGTIFRFFKLGAGRLTIDAADSDVIYDSGAGDTIYSDSSLAAISLQLISATVWGIISANGTWVTTD
jgi:hypothetical protein